MGAFHGGAGDKNLVPNTAHDHYQRIVISMGDFSL
jgi:hypothetical protein